MKKIEKRVRKVPNELETYRRLINKFPEGILSIVSDTFDLWRIITKTIPELKEEILARDGKLVIRPDSGDPVDIICGIKIGSYDTIDYAKRRFRSDLQSSQVHGESEYTIDSERIVKVQDKYYRLTESTEWNRYDKQYYYPDEINIDFQEVESQPSYKGVIELLWDVFGGTVNDQGYKVLDPHIGAIYGDSITIDRADQICGRLEAKGFASTNIVLGVGSFTYQYNTRDTFGFAMKATYVEVTEQVGTSIGEVGTMNAPKVIGREIFKDPITDDGTKKSATGLLSVQKDEAGNLVLHDKVDWNAVQVGELKDIYFNGTFMNQVTLDEIRSKIKALI